jgi:hypothetical protein
LYYVRFANFVFRLMIQSFLKIPKWILQSIAQKLKITRSLASFLEFQFLGLILNSGVSFSAYTQTQICGARRFTSVVLTREDSVGVDKRRARRWWMSLRFQATCRERGAHPSCETPFISRRAPAPLANICAHSLIYSRRTRGSHTYSQGLTSLSIFFRVIAARTYFDTRTLWCAMDTPANSNTPNPPPFVTKMCTRDSFYFLLRCLIRPE